MSKVSLSPGLEEVLAVSGIELEKGKLHFSKPYRNCGSIALFVTAVNYALLSKDKEIAKLYRENAKLSDERSKEASQRAALAERCEQVTKTAISRGLETTEIPPATRERLLNVNDC